MPTYEYRCQDCRHRFNQFMTYAEYGQKVVICPNCKSNHVVRKIGRIRVARSNDTQMDDFSDPGNLEGLEEDPRALGRMMRQMSKQVGEEMPPEFDEVVDRLEKGQSPDDIERDLPNLGSDLGSSPPFQAED